MDEKLIISLMDISIFEFEEMETFDGESRYDNVIFKFDSLSKYNSMIVYINLNWDIEVYDNVGLIAEFNIYETSEFKNTLRNRLL